MSNSSSLYPVGKKALQSRYVSGELIFYTPSGTEIYRINPTTAVITYASGSTVKLASGASLVDASEAVVAALGTTTANAAVLSADQNIITGADGTKGVRLPLGVAGKDVVVINSVGTSILKVYPDTGGQINAGGANVAFSLGPGHAAVFYCTAALVWYVAASAATAATPTELALLNGAGTGGTPVASKVQVADANQNIGVVKATALHIGATGAEVQVTATPAEINLLVGITAGSNTASKVVSRTAAQGIPLAMSVVAALGATAGDGAPLTKDLNLVTGANGTLCVVLPVGVADEVIVVVNTVANQVLPVFPNGTENINGLGAGVVYTIGAARRATFACTAPGVWYVESLTAALPTVTEQNVLAGATAGTAVASKAVVLNAAGHTSAVKTAALSIGASGVEVDKTNVLIGVAAGYKIARGVSAVTGTATVATGLTTVVAITATAQDNLDGDALAGVSATIGNQAGAPVAGSVILNTWKVTVGGAAGNPTLIAATVAKNLNWVAVGV